MKSSILDNTPTTESNTKWPTLKLFKCGSGYECKEDSKTCKNTENPHQCTVDLALYKEWLSTQGITNTCNVFEWEKNCTPQGLYKKIQAKSNPYVEQKNVNRFCADPNGNRLFGEAPLIVDDDKNDMTCKCSRKVWDLTQNIVLSDEENLE